jgi:fibronectin-binding autotransporter adhesin
VENVAPAATDNLIWDSTRTAAGLYSFGNGQFTGGVTIQNPGGLVQLRVASNGTTTWANSALIDMSAATVNAEWTAGTLRIDSNNSSPAVTVAPGRTLTIGGSGISNRANSKTLSMLGSGDIVINAVMGGGAMNLWINGPTVTMNAASSGWSTGIQTLTGANSYTGGTSIEGGSVVLNAEGAKLGSGPVTLSNGANLTMFRGNANDNNTFPAFSNELIIPSGQSGSFYSMPRGTWSGALSGAGTLDLRVNYVRGDVTGNWSGFTGQINVTARSGGDDFRIATGGGGIGLQLAGGKLNLAAGVKMYQSTIRRPARARKPFTLLVNSPALSGPRSAAIPSRGASPTGRSERLEQTRSTKARSSTARGPPA